MSEAKHTPGSWEVGDLDHAGQRIVRQEHIEICTCWHHSVGSIEREMEANARLIAAAPEMLAALKAVVKWHGKRDAADDLLTFERQSAEIQVAMAAVAKAEGREP